MRSPFCLCIPCITFWMVKPIFMKFGMYNMSSEPISKAYFPLVCVSICIPLQRIHRNTRIVGRVLSIWPLPYQGKHGISFSRNYCLHLFVNLCLVCLKNALDISDCIAPNGSVSIEYESGKDIEGSDCGLIWATSRYLPPETQGGHNKETTMIAYMWSSSPLDIYRLGSRSSIGGGGDIALENRRWRVQTQDFGIRRFCYSGVSWEEIKFAVHSLVATQKDLNVSFQRLQMVIV